MTQADRDFVIDDYLTSWAELWLAFHSRDVRKKVSRAAAVRRWELARERFEALP